MEKNQATLAAVTEGIDMHLDSSASRVFLDCEGANNAAGFGFDQKAGDYSGLTNVRPFSVEFAPNMKGVLDNWLNYYMCKSSTLSSVSLVLLLMVCSSSIICA